METRTINQAKIYYLVMNPITDRTEATRITAMSFERQSLVEYYNREAVEIYREDNWSKAFRKGSLLEWLNPLYSFEVGHYGHGIKEDWVNMDSIDQLKNNYNWV